MLLWMYSIAGSVCILVLSAGVATQLPAMAGVHLFVAGLVSTIMVLLALSETRKLIKDDESQITVIARLMRYMGLIWAWGALTIIVTYGTGILEWSAWWQYFASSPWFLRAASACLYLSLLMRRLRTIEGRRSRSMLRLT